MTATLKRFPKILRSDGTLLAAISLVILSPFVQVPESLAQSTFSLSYSARLTSSAGAPLEGPVTFKATFWDSESAGQQLGPSIAIDSAPLTNGMLTVDLPLSASQISDVFGDGTRSIFIEITAGEKTYPRQMYSFVPLALRVPIDDKNLKFNPSGKLTLAVGAKPNANSFLTQDSDGALSWGSPATSGAAIVDQDVAAGAAISQSKIAGLATSLGGKESAVAAGTSSQYYRGDKTWQELSTAAVAESGTGLYYTDARARSALTGSGPINYSLISGTIGIDQASGSAHGYLSSADWSTFAGKQNALGYSPLNKAGDTMSGDLDMGLGDFKNAGNISMRQSKTLLLSNNATDPAGLTVSDKGKTWFNSATNEIKYWDGNTSKALGIAGSGLVNLNGVTSTTQTFATPGTAGIAPAWASSGSAHTLNIPLASTSGVTAGLIANSDYTAFSGKVGGVAAGVGIAVSTTSGTATVNLANTSVTAGTYGRANITVDAQGRLTAAQSAPAIVDADISGSAAIAQSKISGLSTSLGAKEDAIAVGTNAEYFRGDKTWQSLTTSAVTEGTNLYYSDARSRAALTPSAPVTYSVVSGTIGINQASSSVDGYLSSADWATFNGKQNSLGFSPLNKAGDTMAGTLDMNSAAITNTGNIVMAAGKTLLLSNSALDPTGLSTGDKGKTWFNTATSEIKYWDGTTAKALGIAGSGLQSLNGLSANSQTFATPGTSGTVPAWSSIGSAHTLNIPLAAASGVTAGLISNTDFASFTNKISSVTAGTGLTGGGSSGPVTISADVGTTANKLVQLDATAKLPAVDASALTSLTPANLASAVPVSKGGTGLTSGTSGGIPYFNAASTMASSAVLTANGVVLGSGAGAAPTTTAAGLANTVLRVASGGGAPSFGALDISQASAVTGLLNLGNGGTGTSLLLTGGTGQYLKQTTSGAAVSVGTIAAADLPSMGGDSGSGGTKGAVPAPASGDSAAGKFLKADGSWSVPAGTTNWAAPGTIGSTAPNTGAFTTLTASGNVGIGTTAPSSLLSVGSSSQFQVNSNGDLARINSVFYNWPSSQGAANQVLTNNGSGTLTWAASGGSQWTSISNYGIYYDGGNSGPGAAGNYGTGLPPHGVVIHGYQAEGWKRYADFVAVGGDISSDMRFYTMAAGGAYGVRMQIASTGNIGIGTTAPGARLDVSSSGAGLLATERQSNTVAAANNSGAQTLYAVNRTTSGLTSVAGVGGIITDISDTAYKGALILSTANNSAPAERMRIDSTGNVGIGTTAPGYGLDVNSLGAAFGTGTGAATVYLRDVANASWALGTGGYQLGFYNNNGGSYVSKMVITNAGNVGIGTTAPSAKLKVDGGQIAGSFATNSTATIDWNAGNVQTTSAAAGTITFTAGSLIDGGAYTLAFNNATGGSYTFTSTGLTFKCNPACPLTVTAGKDTVATFIKAGTTVYVSWVKDFQ